MLNTICLLSSAEPIVEFVNIPKIDVSLSFSLIIAVCSIISPIFVARTNNKHQQKMKILEYKQLEREQFVLYKRNIFENYLRYLSENSKISSTETRANYAQYYSLAYLYASEDLRKKMSAIDQKFHTLPPDIDTNDLDEITKDLSNLIQSL